jgi:hypothetical protein
VSISTYVKRLQLFPYLFYKAFQRLNVFLGPYTNGHF